MVFRPKDYVLTPSGLGYRVNVAILSKKNFFDLDEIDGNLDHFHADLAQIDFNEAEQGFSSQEHISTEDL